MRKSSEPAPTLVIDASVTVWALLPILSSLSFDLLDRFGEWQAAGHRLVAPPLWLAECTSAIRFAVHKHAALTEEGHEAVQSLFSLGVEILPADVASCQAALRWAEKLGQARAYDGFYLAAAEQEGAEFWTADRRLANAAQQNGATWAHWIGET